MFDFEYLYTALTFRILWAVGKESMKLPGQQWRTCFHLELQSTTAFHALKNTNQSMLNTSHRLWYTTSSPTQWEHNNYRPPPLQHSILYTSITETINFSKRFAISGFMLNTICPLWVKIITLSFPFFTKLILFQNFSSSEIVSPTTILNWCMLSSLVSRWKQKEIAISYPQCKSGFN